MEQPAGGFVVVEDTVDLVCRFPKVEGFHEDFHMIKNVNRGPMQCRIYLQQQLTGASGSKKLGTLVDIRSRYIRNFSKRAYTDSNGNWIQLHRCTLKYDVDGVKPLLQNIKGHNEIGCQSANKIAFMPITSAHLRIATLFDSFLLMYFRFRKGNNRKSTGMYYKRDLLRLYE